MTRRTISDNGTISVWCTHCRVAVAYTLSFGQPQPEYLNFDQCFHCAAGEPIACAKGESCNCRFQQIARAQAEWSIPWAELADADEEAAWQAASDLIDPSDLIHR